MPDKIRHIYPPSLRLLADNRISHVGAGDLYGLTSLQWVDLNANPLATLAPSAFRALPSLLKL